VPGGFARGNRAGSMSAREGGGGGSGGEAPIFWEQHLPPSSLSSVNLEVLAEKVSTLGLQGRTWLSTISFIQANLQRSIAASRVLSRT
jgi:hypothetical protein